MLQPVLMFTEAHLDQFNTPENKGDDVIETVCC